GYYAIDARKLAYGGGPSFDVFEVVARTLSLAIGGPDAGLLRNAATLIALCLISFGFVALVRRKSDEAAFFAASLVLAPAGILLCYHAHYLDVRYFFVLFPFVWLLCARTLASLSDQGMLRQVAAVTVVIAATAGNVLHLT